MTAVAAVTALPGAAWRRLRRASDVLAAFAVPALIYAAILAQRSVRPLNPHGKATILTSDLDNQYAQFYSYFDQALTGHGSLLFTWRSDLGMNFWPIVSYYLTSPFGFLTLFSDDRRLPIMIAVVTVLKVGTAGLGMQLLLRRFRRPGPDGRAAAGSTAMAVLLSAGYALAAWTLVYAFNIMWLDALFLLPLVLLGVEVLLARGRIAPLALAFGVTFILNFYTGAMIGVFAVLYGVARYFGYRERFVRKEFLVTGLRFVVATVIGVLISSAFLLPAYLGGISQKTGLTATASVRPPVNALSILVRFFGGTFDKGATTPNVAAGTLVLLLAPLFFTVKSVSRAERIAFGGVLAFLLAATEVPPLYLLMHGGDMPNAFPYRFAFLITALLVFLAFRAWVGIDSMRQVKQLLGLGVLWLVVLYIGATTFGRILPRPVVRFDGAVLVLGTAVLAFTLWLRVRDQEAPLPSRVRRLPRWLFSPRVAAAAAVSVLTLDVAGSASLVEQKVLVLQTAHTTGTALSWPQWYGRPSTSYGTALQGLVPAQDDFFRAEGNDRNLRSTNDSLRYGNFAQTHFSSLSSGKLHVTLADLGFAHYDSYVWASHTGATLFTDALLGYRYLVGTTRAGSTGDVDRLGLSLVKTYDDTKSAKNPDITKVYQVQDTLPVGFRLPDANLAAMLQPLPTADPFAAQEQVFQAPGAFETPCGAPTVTGGAGLTVTPAADGGVDMVAARGAKSGPAKVIWTCTSPGPRQVYLYAPRAFPGQFSYARLDTPTTRPLDPKHPESALDPANKYYPFGWSNDIQDMGTVQSGSFTVTLNAPDVQAGGKYHIPPNAVRSLDASVVSAKLAQLRQGAVTAVHWDDTGLSASTSGERAATVFFSIPSIPGWSVDVDGGKVKTTELLGSFVGVPVPAGTHRISFGFTPPGLIAGVGGSVVGVVALGVVWWFQRRRTTRPAATDPATPDQIHEDVLS